MPKKPKGPPQTVREFLCRLFGCDTPEPKPSITWTIGVGNLVVQFSGDWYMKLPIDKHSDASVAFFDSAGNAAAVDGAPVWASDSPGVATVVASADGMSAVVTPVALGTAQISVEADADLGAGIVTLLGTGTVEVVGGQAVTATISFAEPA